MSLSRFIGIVISLHSVFIGLRADSHVVVIADSNPDYARARLDENGKTRTETYVFMQGRFYEGMVRNRSLERTSFRELAVHLVPELAKKSYRPAPNTKNADLLLVVHWGTTSPQASLRELTASPTQELDHDRLLYEKIQKFNPGQSMEKVLGGDVPGAAFDLPEEYRPKFGHDNQTAEGFTQLEEVAQETSRQMRRSNNAALLGYNQVLYREGKRIWSGEDERAMNYDLNMERYFIIIRAYDLKKRIPGASPKKPVWTMHLNISVPGNNFKSALTRMGEGVARFAGQGSGGLDTFRAGQGPAGKVTLGDLIILGEVSPK